MKKTTAKILGAAVTVCVIGAVVPVAASAATVADSAAQQMAKTQIANVKILKKGGTPQTLASQGIEAVEAATASYPKKFDLRACSPDLNGDGYLEAAGKTSYVTSVKNQGYTGDCWAFSIIAASETSYLSSTLTPAQDSSGKDAVDFSEKHLAWFTYSSNNDGTSGQEGEGTTSPFYSPHEIGGDEVAAARSAVSSGIGPVLESEDSQFLFRGYTLDKNDKRTSESTFYVRWSSVSAADSKAELVLPSGAHHTIAQWRDASGHPAWNKAFEKWYDSVSEDELESYVLDSRNWKKLTLDDVYAYSLDDDWSVDDSLRYSSSVSLTESRELPEPADWDEDGNYIYNEEATNVMKSELMQGRAVSVAFVADQAYLTDGTDVNKYLNSETWGQYAYKHEEANHAVTVVGWDDTYSATNFLSEIMVADEGGNPCYNKDGSVKTRKVSQPPADGAWIVKNSWGGVDSTSADYAEWGDDGSGYFYISYYDQSLCDPMTLLYTTKITNSASQKGKAVGQYDYMNSTISAQSVEYKKATSSASVFMASKRTKVSAVSCVTNSASNTVTFQLYKLNKGATKPTDGKLLKTVTKSFDYAGFHKVSLGKSYTMAKGTKYAVVVTIQDVNGKYVVPYTCGFNNNYFNAYFDMLGGPFSVVSVGVVNKGESYIIRNGKSTDWATVIAKLEKKLAKDNFENFMDYDNIPIRAY